jgi:hypothetical protein
MLLPFKDERFCIDSSVLIHLRNLPREARFFEPIWTGLEGLVRDGRLMSPKEVRDEIYRQDDVVAKWCKAQKALFAEVDPGQEASVKKIMARFPAVAAEAQRLMGPYGDPWVVALGESTGSVVLSRERSRNPKRDADVFAIPDMCSAIGVQHVGFEDFLNRMAWTGPTP